MLDKDETIDSPSLVSHASPDDIEAIEIALLLEAVYQRYGSIFVITQWRR